MDDIEKRPNIIETAIAAGIAQNCIVTVAGVSLALVPKGFHLEDLEKYGASPRRLNAKPSFVSLDSFISYVGDYKGDHTRIYADTKTGVLTAALDHHELDSPSWNSHVARYAPMLTEEWNRWKASDGKWMPQAEFAEFIENNYADITRPNGATMLEIAKTFEAKTSTEFKSGIRLDNGNQKLTFAQDTQARAGTSNELEIPEVFDLALVPFAFGEAYPVTARLRYRINEEKQLRLKYQLINPHKVIESLVLSILTAIGEKLEITPLIVAQ